MSRQTVRLSPDKSDGDSTALSADLWASSVGRELSHTLHLREAFQRLHNGFSFLALISTIATRYKTKVEGRQLG